ncbi:hypothetical protein BT63DRAFT_428963 [Microthyrium microscopicum]|uniref:Mediator of RNA polymerase II transcription subunit 21 n=1 Tax=Microthyrium microscopicum TaxID=703497 RepID=A0A6A6U0Q5_9PEZI|nr:hypothetical protein BT63DRAFT_428963 [Microthyrium microscopicum]
MNNNLRILCNKHHFSFLPTPVTPSVKPNVVNLPIPQQFEISPHLHHLNTNRKMADRLTQIQDCLDQLMTQMYATIHYIDTRHHYAHIPGQTDQFGTVPATDNTPASQVTLVVPGGSTQTTLVASTNNTQGGNTQGSTATDGAPENDGVKIQPDPHIHARLTVLAQDLVLKEQQLEALVASLPGLGDSEASQERRIKELTAELGELDVEAKETEAEKDELVGRLERLLEGVRRV